MHHDDVNDKHHAVTLHMGDRIKARRDTEEMRADALYEVIGFHDRPDPERHFSCTLFAKVGSPLRIRISNRVLQTGFLQGDWTLV